MLIKCSKIFSLVLLTFHTFVLFEEIFLIFPLIETSFDSCNFNTFKRDTLILLICQIHHLYTDIVSFLVLKETKDHKFHHHKKLLKGNFIFTQIVYFSILSSYSFLRCGSYEMKNKFIFFGVTFGSIFFIELLILWIRLK